MNSQQIQEHMAIRDTFTAAGRIDTKKLRELVEKQSQLIEGLKKDFEKLIIIYEK